MRAWLSTPWCACAAGRATVFRTPLPRRCRNAARTTNRARTRLRDGQKMAICEPSAAFGKRLGEERKQNTRSDSSRIRKQGKRAHISPSFVHEKAESRKNAAKASGITHERATSSRSGTRPHGEKRRKSEINRAACAWRGERRGRNGWFRPLESSLCRATQAPACARSACGFTGSSLFPRGACGWRGSPEGPRLRRRTPNQAA